MKSKKDIKTLKILISPAHYYFSDKYGSEPGYAYSLVKYIGEKMPKIDVIVGSVDIVHPLPQNINLIAIYKGRSTNPTIELLKYLLFYPLVCLRYLQLHKRYDVVHHMFPTSPVTVDPLLILIKMVNPSTKIVIGPLQLLSKLNSPDDLSTMLIGKQHRSILTTVLPSIYSFLILITTPFAKLTFQTTDMIVCNFSLIKNYYENIYKGKAFNVIPTGVDPLGKDFPLTNKKKETVTIICVGKLQTHKGQTYLLEAFRLLKENGVDVKLFLVGEGRMQESLKIFVKKNKLEKDVVFTGFIPRSEVANWYSKADIYCLPSLIDTNPVVIQEAMSQRLPIVASDVGAVAEIVNDAGIVVEKANKIELYKALKKLVENKMLREKMGAIGYNRVKRLYTWDKIADQWLTLYQNL